MSIKLSERVGELFVLDGFTFKILRYVNNKEVYIGIYKGSKKLGSVKTSYGNFNKRTVSNPFSPKVCGVGYLGVAGATSTSDSAYKIYKCWQDMIHRCYNPKNRSYKNYGGKGVVVSEEWKNFSSFKQWYLKNDYSLEGNLVLDKDILSFLMGSVGIYSEKTCILVPLEINTAIIEKDGEIKGYSKTKNGKYVVYVSTGGVHKNVGYFDSEAEARLAYEKAKRKSLEEILSRFKVPKEVSISIKQYIDKKYPEKG